MTATKIATCCYCGTRAALVLKSRGRHELACASCGAPLHDMKMLPKAAVREGSGRGTVARTAAHPPRPVKDYRKVRRRKGLFRRAIEEAVDLLEDIFD